MGILLDLVVLLGLTKESVQMQRSLPFSLWTVVVLALPFFLGVGGALRTEGPLYLRNYIRVFIGQGLTIVSVVLYMAAVSVGGLDTAFMSLFAIVVSVYAAGRMTAGFLRPGVIALGLLVLLAAFYALRQG